MIVNSQAPIPNIVNSHTLLKFAQKLLQNVGINSFVIDSKVLLEKVLNYDRLNLELNKNNYISQDLVINFLQLLERRLCYEPIAYIIGQKEFYGLDFFVDKNCLIPRPDTECVVEACLNFLGLKSKALVFDLCTGSGAIAISLLKNCPHINVIASDISNKALAITSKNAQNLGVIDRLELLCGDLFEPFNKNIKADLIVINPPYISIPEMDTLDKDVYDYEPHLALCSNDNLGIAFYERIIKSSQDYLAKDAVLILEIGYKQEDLLRRIAKKYFNSIKFFKDLASNTRGVILHGNVKD